MEGSPRGEEASDPVDQVGPGRLRHLAGRLDGAVSGTDGGARLGFGRHFESSIALVLGSCFRVIRTTGPGDGVPVRPWFSGLGRCSGGSLRVGRAL